jgi:hypothetical protein
MLVSYNLLLKLRKKNGLKGKKKKIYPLTGRGGP